MSSKALEFKCQVDEVYSTYIDSIFGYSNISKNLDESQRQNIIDLKNTDPEKASINFLDDQEICYSISDTEIVKGNTRQYKLRNSLNGTNWQWAARMFIVTIYELWECEYRSKIAAQNNLPPEKFKVPIMGDLRRLRHWIIHSKSIPDANVRKLEVIDWCVENQELQFNFEKIYAIVNELRKALERI